MDNQHMSGFTLREAFFESLVGICPDPIIGIDRGGTVTLFNEAAQNLTGWKSGEVLGRMRVTRLYQPPEMARQVKKIMHGPEKGGIGRVRNLEVKLVNREGKSVPILLSAVILAEDGVEVGSVGFFHDLTRTRQLEALSITDSLTGLYNRHHFHSTMAKEISRCTRFRHPLSLVLFDLDNFKPFNDNFGHLEGDNILRLVGRCARELIRSQDHAFRLGGDEFALLLVETDLESGALVAERFRLAFNDQWFEAMSTTGKELRPVSMSLGLAEFKQADDLGDTGENADNLIMRADMAMYEAKRRGGDRVVKASAYIGEEYGKGPKRVFLRPEDR